MGHIAARAAVESWVLVPQLQAWQVPDEVTWDLGNLPAPMPLELHRNKVVVHWRPGLSAAWRTVPRSNHLQLAPRCGEIRLRAELRSRHAAVSDRAMLVVERSGRVLTSQPVLQSAARSWVAMPKRSSVMLQTPRQHCRRWGLRCDWLNM